MNALNQIILEGNVVRQPEKRVLQSGFKVCTIPLAVNRHYRNTEGVTTDEVSFFDVDTYGNLAEACEKWCPTGRGIRVVGRLTQERWQTEEGKTKPRGKIIAEHVEFKYFNKKDSTGNAKSEANEKEGPASADLGTPALTKKQKLAMLAEAAAAAQKEQEGEEVNF